MKSLTHQVTILLLLLTTYPLTAFSQWLEKPLAFVPADSVNIWSYTGTDMRQYVLMRDSTVKTPLFSITDEMLKRREEIKQLCDQLTAHLNIVGGGDDERTVAQGLPARMNIAANAYMLLLTGQARHADLMERSLLNASVQTSGCSRLPFRQRDRHASFESLLAFSGLMYAQNGIDLYINLYTNSVARIQLGDNRFTFDQITEMPSDGTIKMRISQLAHPTRIRLHLRMPDWVTHRMPASYPFTYTQPAPSLPRIFVSGHELEEPQMDANGYVVIDRTWQSLDEVFLTFPFQPLIVRRATTDGTPQRGAVALQLGPLVYAIPNLPEGCYFSTNSILGTDDLLTSGGFPYIKGQVFRQSGTPADAPAPAVNFKALPFCEQTDSVGTVWCTECK